MLEKTTKHAIKQKIVSHGKLEDAFKLFIRPPEGSEGGLIN